MIGYAKNDKREGCMVFRGDESKAATAARLRLVRNALGLSQSKMAVLIGTTTSNYQHMERGDTYPQPPQVHKLLLEHGVDHNFIYHGDWSRVPSELWEKIKAQTAS